MSGAGVGPGSIAGDLKRKEREAASIPPRTRAPSTVTELGSRGARRASGAGGPPRSLSLAPSPSQSLNTFPPPEVHS